MGYKDTEWDGTNADYRRITRSLGLLDKGRLLAVGTPEEIKGLMRGTILEIRADRPRQAAAVLRGRFGHGGVGLFGDRVHVVTEEAEKAHRQADSALAAAGISVAEIRPVPPTLEDVFISVLGAEN